MSGTLAAVIHAQRRRGDSECRGNEIHAWKTYMEMKGFLSASKSGERRSQSFARNARASSRRSRCTGDLARIPRQPRSLQLLALQLLISRLVWPASRTTHCCGARGRSPHHWLDAVSLNELSSSHVENILSLRDLRFSLLGQKKKLKHKFISHRRLKRQQRQCGVSRGQNAWF